MKQEIYDWKEGMKKHLKDWRKMLANNGIWLNRNKGVGVITKEQAIDMGFTGPNLRGSGVAHDLLDFEPAPMFPQQ